MKKMIELSNGRLIEIDVHPKGLVKKYETFFTVGAWLGFSALVWALAVFAYIIGGPYG